MELKRYYSEKEVEKILVRASNALSDLSIPKLIPINDKPIFNGRNTYYGWKEYLLTGNIDNEWTKKALEQYESNVKTENSRS